MLRQFEVTIAAFSTANLPVVGDYIRLGHNFGDNLKVTVINGDFASQAEFSLSPFESVKLNREFEELIFENTTDLEKTYVVTVGRGSVFTNSTDNVNILNTVLNVEAQSPLQIFEPFNARYVFSVSVNATDTETDLIAPFWSLYSDWAGGDFLIIQNRSATNSAFIGFGNSEPLNQRYELKPNQEFKIDSPINGVQLLTAICSSGQNADLVVITSYNFN